jgi:polar amino acid transport system substrate-binding protein
VVQKIPGWLRAGATALAAFVFCACASTHAPVAPASPAPPPALRVAIATNYPPIAFKQNGKITGVEAQFAKKLGPALGTQVTVVETPWEDLIPALRERRIDVIMSGMSVTDERKQLVSFVHPYLRVGQMLLVRRADAERWQEDAAINLPTTRVGFVTATTGETYVQQHFAKAEAKGFDSVTAAVAALRAGRIDVFVHDAPSIYALSIGGDAPERELAGRFEPRTEEYLAWAVRQDDTQLRAQLNAILAKWNADGTLEGVLNNWIKTSRPAPRTP